MFECRSVLNDFYQITPLVMWHTNEIIKKHMGAVAIVLENLGENCWENFVPSAKAFENKKKFYEDNGVAAHLVREEWSCTTKGLLAWLVVWSQERHKVEERNQASAILEALLGGHLRAEGYFHKRICFKYDTEMDDCVQRNTQGIPCRCLRFEMRGLANSHHLWSWHAFCKFLEGIAVGSPDGCAAFPTVFGRLMGSLTLELDAAILEMKAADLLKEMKGFKTVSGKRRRVDEDFKAALTELGTSDGYKIGDVARFTGLCGERSAYTASNVQVKARRAAAQRALTCSGVVVVADDASGHGKPAETTIMSLVCDAVEDYTAPGQPMVLGGFHDLIRSQPSADQFPAAISGPQH
jgi:hypothetical protein